VAYFYRPDMGTFKIAWLMEHTVTQDRSQPLLILRDRKNSSENDDRS
jgi:hypothetical protein